jgi:hypothetical protein
VRISNVLSWIVPLAAAFIGLAGALWSAIGATAETRLVRRSQRLLDLAERLPRRQLRVELREAAAEDARQALRMRATGRPLTSGVVCGAVFTAAAFLVPAWIQHHPAQGVGWQGAVWIVTWLLYLVATFAAWTFVGLMLLFRARSTA